MNVINSIDSMNHIHLNTKCNKCGIDVPLCIHHKDGNRKNNNPENLEVLCYNCHALIHGLGKLGRSVSLTLNPEILEWLNSHTNLGNRSKFVNNILRFEMNKGQGGI